MIEDNESKIKKDNDQKQNGSKYDSIFDDMLARLDEMLAQKIK